MMGYFWVHDTSLYGAWCDFRQFGRAVRASKHFDFLRTEIEKIPLFDCHDHAAQCGPRLEDPIHAALGDLYLRVEMECFAGAAARDAVYDSAWPLEERWRILEPIWAGMCHTDFAQVTRKVLKRFYGEDRLTLQALKRM